MADPLCSTKPLSAIVVGLGHIGMGYDRHLPEDTHVLSHVRALHRHSSFYLVAAVDPNPDIRQQFSADTGLPAYDCLEALPGALRADVVVLACPTVAHPSSLNAVLARMCPRAVLCEKPLALSIAEGDAMRKACERAGVELFVNFIRRADPAVREVRARIEDGRIAGPLKAVVWYSKGMLHNGSHFVDLMSHWLGPISAGQIIAPGRRVGDNDAEADFLLSHVRGTSLFCAAREECFSHYTVEIVAANGRLRYERGGEILWQGVEADAQVPGYHRLARAAQPIANDMDHYQLNVMTELARALDGESHGLCSGEEALVSQGWLDRLYRERDSTKE